MRTVFCACGRRVVAADDDTLFYVLRAHVDQEHPERGFTDEQLRAVTSANSFDIEDARALTADPQRDAEIEGEGRRSYQPLDGRRGRGAVSTRGQHPQDGRI